MEPFAPLQQNSLNPNRLRPEGQHRGKVAHKPAPTVNTRRLVVAYFFASMTVQLCDFLFPLFLFAGIIWLALPLVLSSLLPSVSTTDPQIHDIVSSLLPALESPLHVGWFSLGAFAVILLGLFFLFLSSACLSFLSWVENDGYK